jgi:Ca-activated chloride channel homolog
MLLSLVLIPLFVGVYVRAHRRRQRFSAIHAFGLAQDPVGISIGRRRHWPPLLFISGLTLLLIALARPQAVLSLPRVEGTVILAFDVSGSMAADDLEPTRMDAAKAAALEFVENQPSGILIGVVAFSDGGLAVQAPTNDKEAILATINRLTPQRGTSLANGILASLNLIFPDDAPTFTREEATPLPSPTPLPRETYSPAVIILLTDGENNMEPDQFAAAQTASDRGVRIYTIGIGSPTGADLQIGDFIVHTELDETTLQYISAISEGTYYNAQSEEDLRGIYDNIEPQLTIKTEPVEMTSVFGGTSMLLFLAGVAISLLWFGRVL